MNDFGENSKMLIFPSPNCSFYPLFEKNKNFPQKIGSVWCVYWILIHVKNEKKVMSLSWENGVTDGRTDRTGFIGTSDINIYHKRVQNLEVCKYSPHFVFFCFDDSKSPWFYGKRYLFPFIHLCWAND